MNELESLAKLGHTVHGGGEIVRFLHENMPWLDVIVLIFGFLGAVLLAFSICFSILDKIPKSRPEAPNAAAVLIGSVISYGAWAATCWFMLVAFTITFSPSVRDLSGSFGYTVLGTACFLNLLSIGAIGHLVRERTKFHPRAHAFAVGLLFIGSDLLFAPQGVSFGQPLFVYILTLLAAVGGDLILGALFFAGIFIAYLLSDKDPDASPSTHASSTQRCKTSIREDKSKAFVPARTPQLTKNKQRLFIVTPSGTVLIQQSI